MTNIVTQVINAPVHGPVVGGNLNVHHLHMHHHGSPVNTMGAAPVLGLVCTCILAVSAALASIPAASSLTQEPPVPMEALASGPISAIGYEGSARKMYVQFSTVRDAHTFCNVPKEIHSAMMGSPSKGLFFHQSVWGNFECKSNA